MGERYHPPDIACNENLRKLGADSDFNSNWLHPIAACSQPFPMARGRQSCGVNSLEPRYIPTPNMKKQTAPTVSTPLLMRAKIRRSMPSKC